MENKQNNPQQFSPEDIQSMQRLLTLAKMANGKRPGAQDAAKNQTPAERRPIDLFDLFWYIMDRLKYVVIAALIGAILGGIYGYQSFSPTYTATSKLYILGGGTSIQAATLSLGNQLAEDYKEVFKTWEVHETVRQSLGLNYSYEQLQNMLTVRVPDSSRVLYVTVKNKNPSLAADLANEYATAAKNFILKTMDAQEPSMFSLALVPSASATNSSSSFIMLGFLGGAALCIAAFAGIYWLDDSPSSAEDIEWTTGMDVLTIIPLEWAQEREAEKKKNRRRSVKKEDGKRE